MEHNSKKLLYLKYWGAKMHLGKLRYLATMLLETLLAGVFNAAKQFIFLETDWVFPKWCSVKTVSTLRINPYYSRCGVWSLKTGSYMHSSSGVCGFQLSMGSCGPLCFINVNSHVSLLSFQASWPKS